MRTTSRWFIGTVFTVGVLSFCSPARSAAADITGDYSGSYNGPQGTTRFTLSLTEQEGRGGLAGVLTSRVESGAEAVVSTTQLTGFYSAPGRRFQLRSNIERTAPAANRTMLFINGTYDPNGGQGAGQLSGTILITQGRPVPFEATRAGMESANVTNATNAPAKTSAPPPPAVPPAAPAQTVTTIDGVYNGTYTGGAGQRTLKLALRAFDNGTLAGIFTLYDPPTSHDHAYSFSLTGKIEPGTGKFILEPAKWLTPAPGYFMVGIAGTFDAKAGKVAGNLTSGRRGPFEATRDAAESKDIAKLIAAPAGAAAEATQLAGQLPEIKQPTAANVNGVYLGFVGCSTGGKMTAKLSLKATDISTVTGLLTVELPSDVGSAVTYKLKGTWRLGVVNVDASVLGAQVSLNYAISSLTVRDTTAGMGKIAAHLRGDARSRAGCEIDVVRDEEQSAKLDDVMSAQSAEATSPETLAKAAEHTKALQAAAAVAAKEQAAKIKTAAPAQLASKDLVRKSPNYWAAYHGDLIREVFDGGFGDGLGDNTQFQLLFTHYVEAFSRDCKDALPARHETVAITQFKEVRNIYGNLLRKDALLSWTVECDSRFAPYYTMYAKELERRGGAFAVAVATHRAFLSDLSDPVEDIERFFHTEKSKSAAMHQLGENLLRAAENHLSLQQAGEKIAGAAAETDPNLSPGRYARFVDGCNGWFRDPANAYYRTGQSSAWCQCMGDKYQRTMSREEEYYYANDFGPRFRDQIAQSQSTDPAWNRLHQAAQDCRQ